MKEPSKSASVSPFLRTDSGRTRSNAIEVPSIELPKGGGALKGIDEKFSVNAVNGTSSFSIPLPFSGARGAVPTLALAYNSGSGNGIFGLGWDLSLPSIKRKTDKGLPRYLDARDSDTFLFSEAEDLVPEFRKDNTGSFELDSDNNYIINEKDSADGLFTIRYYKPRIEGLFARIERWTAKNVREVKWSVTTKNNITTLFGWTSGARIENPAEEGKVFQWLPEFVYDDKGNISHYIYKKEDGAGLDLLKAHNRNRVDKNGTITYTNHYLEKICYGNKTPYNSSGGTFPQEDNYLFSTVFDYGEYNNTSPYNKVRDWDFRNDAFSDYKPGFEIRTTRTCKRVLLFHHFSEYNALVKSLDLGYDTASEENFTFLTSITSCGYIKKADGSYSCKKLPHLEFAYQKHDWNKEIRTISAEDLANAPTGPDEQQYQFIDLYNEGLNGILTEQANGWYYKHNLGNNTFAPAKLVSPKPSFTGLGDNLQLADLDADGGKQLVSFNEESAGFFELDDNNEWQNFKPFETLPNLNFGDANARMLDLNGDGRPEVVLSEEQCFTWYGSEGRTGFSAAQKTPKPFEEEKGAGILFSDATHCVFLANMSGSGLTDIVRVKNGEICYWPNLGYGMFGAKVTMDNAPVFDHPEAFNPSYIRLADIDGSGTSDIIYLGKNRFSCWKNLAGNSFSATPFEIDAFPEVHTQASVTVTDLLGNGVACIVWSSRLSKDAAAPLQYIDLMNGKKPHVMVMYKNNFGKEVTLEYAPSTRFYIEDKLAGKPWATKLHFPVHCVSRTITEDKISGSRFVSSYKYHHGYYDHAEREFRGFGMVEQTDTETFEEWKKGKATNIVEAPIHQEPVVTKSWTHTGAFLQNDTILNRFAQEYWYAEMNRQGFAIAHHETPLPDIRLIAAPGLDPALINKLSPQELREAYRACKSMGLRSEVFAKDAITSGNTQDAIKKELTPFSVATHCCVIELVQPKGTNKHAVFIIKESESITYSYERNPEDPRISHNLNIKLDEYGNVLESAAVVYPRLMPDTSLPPETLKAQTSTIITYTQNRFTNDVVDDGAYLLRQSSEVKTFELKGVPKAQPLYTPQDFMDILDDVRSDTASYHETDKPPGDRPLKRLIEHTRSLYFKNDLTGALPLHKLESLAIPFESYQLAYTPELITAIFDTKMTSALMEEGRFTHSGGDVNWWARSGTAQYIAASENASDAEKRFYTPLSFTNPYGAVTKVKYYGNYFLFQEAIEDALGNTVKVELFNFRTLSAQRMKDINGNLSEVITDELGIVKALAVMGKGNEADELTGITEITDDAETTLISSFFNAGDSAQLVAAAKTLIIGSTSRFVYDIGAYINSGKPAVMASIIREQHFRQNDHSPVQVSFEYADGLGGVIMKKAQAEQLRWIANGRTVKNNKGNPVKQYEPYFSVTHLYEDVKELTETGVTMVNYYDAAGRLMKTEMPDGTLTRAVFDSWQNTEYDANDTILESSWYANRTNRLIDAQLTAQGKDPAREKQAADKAAKHANTPSVLHLDTLGRPVLSIVHNRDPITNADEFYHTIGNVDAEGNLRSVKDARGNIVMQYKYDMLGNLVYQNSADAGERLMAINISGKPLRTWDQRGHEFQYSYDILQRPTQSKVLGGDGPSPLEHIYDRIIYGESLLLAGRTNENDLQARNVLGQVIMHYDTGGSVETPDFDFKGKPLATKRRLFKKYKETVNWIDANLATDLEKEAFTFTTETDALGRISRQIAPDGSIIVPAYNEAGLLESERVTHPGKPAAVYLASIDYNEKGQREKIVYGNNVSIRFFYDKETFRLNRLESKRQNNDPLQEWHYTYDAVGNVAYIEDKNIPTIFFNNTKITGITEYTYDAVYRLAEARGRENDAALNFTAKDNWNDAAFMHQMNPGDPMAIRNYIQRYKYDAVGNILEMRHQTGNSSNSWTRSYNYQPNNNRLISTQTGSNTYLLPHHAQHGFITKLPHLQEMAWNFKEQPAKTIKQRSTDNIPETTYYQYDGEGRRIRKITESQASAGTAVATKEERIYIAGYELYKKHSGSDAGLERVSLSIMDGGHRFVMAETRNDIDDGTAKHLVRYQMHDYLGSCALELDETARVISYEEYHPYGTTAYQAKNAAIKSAAKRYRFTGMERDEETGLEYHTARYYLPWLGRWLSADPIGIADGTNVYAYCKNMPVKKTDTGGKQSEEPSNWNRFTGFLGVVGGGFEAAAGGSMVAGGVATSEVGVGIPIAIGGVAVLAHAVDTIQANFYQMVSGVETDTLTAGKLQDAGLTRNQARMADGLIGVVGSAGGAALAKSLTAAPVAVKAAVPLVEAAAPAARVAAPVAKAAAPASKAAPALKAMHGPTTKAPLTTAAKPTTLYSSAKDAALNAEIVPAATRTISGDADIGGQLTAEFSKYLFKIKGVGYFPRAAKVAVQVMDNPSSGEPMAMVLNHEVQHARDILRHPMLGWWATESNLFGRAILHKWFEMRGYRAQGILKPDLADRAFGSMGLGGTIEYMREMYLIKKGAAIGGIIAAGATATAGIAYGTYNYVVAPSYNSKQKPH